MSSKNNKKQRKESEKHEELSVSGWSEQKKAKTSAFPGPNGATAQLRVAMERSAYADFTGHAKESVDKEVCGVLVGEVFEDEHGRYPKVEGAIRGTAVDQGSQHVTYTQETWNVIHKEIDEKYPKLQIVGWYHSHPGFGVQFSDMDKFIQSNFFGGPEQFGIVTDPLGGDMALIVNGSDGIENVHAFWVDGREQKCWMPAQPQQAGGVMTSDLAERLGDFDSRLSQVVHTLDETRESVHRVVMTAVMLIAVFLIAWIGSKIWQTFRGPELQITRKNLITVPAKAKVGGKDVFLQLELSSFELPPEMNVSLQERLEVQQLMAESERKGYQQAMDQFDATLAAADDETLKKMVAAAKGRLKEADEPKEPKKADRPGTQVFVLWTIIGLIFVLFFVFIIKTFRARK